MKRISIGLVIVGIPILCVGIALGSCTTTEKPVASPPALSACEHTQAGGEAGSEQRVAREDPSPLPPVARLALSGGTTRYSLLITQLGSDDWQTRDAAQKELTEYGEELIGQYRKKKLEVRSLKLDSEVRTVHSELRTIHSELSTLAQALRKACQSGDPEIKKRVKQIRQYFYAMTQPKIAFRSGRDGNSEIYIMSADGSNQTRSTNNQAMDTSPVWNPDGTKIAFQSKQDGNEEIYVMSADGKNQTRLTNNQARDWPPAWSPDGTRIAFQSTRDGNSEIYVMSADGKNQIRLTNNQADNHSPVWSPDGTRIAFGSGWGGNERMYVMSADGKNQTRLTNNQAVDNWPDWKPTELPEISALFSGGKDDK